MTNKNEVAVQEENNGAVLHETGIAKVVSESDRFVVKQTADGKFKRQAKYEAYSSIPSETKEDRMFILSLLDGDEEDGNGLKDFVGEEIEIADVLLNPYDKIVEDTGETEYGVLTYLITPNREKVYVTSSKTVYFGIQRMFDWFGRPDDKNWENIKVKVTSKKGQHGQIIGVKMIG